MKKRIASILCILVLLCSLLCGCGESGSTQNTYDPVVPETEYPYDAGYTEAPAYEAESVQSGYANGNVRSNVIVNGENNQVNVQNNYNDSGSAQNDSGMDPIRQIFDSGSGTNSGSSGSGSTQSDAGMDAILQLFDSGSGQDNKSANDSGNENVQNAESADSYDYDAEQARLNAYNNAQQVLIDSYRDSNSGVGGYNAPTKRVSDCTHCAGTGKCSRCNGTHLMHNPYTGERQVCSSCSYGECPFCGGTGKR